MFIKIFELVLFLRFQTSFDKFLQEGHGPIKFLSSKYWSCVMCVKLKHKYDFLPNKMAIHFFNLFLRHLWVSRCWSETKKKIKSEEDSSTGRVVDFHPAANPRLGILRI